jgi:hypothetical protein
MIPTDRSQFVKLLTCLGILYDKAISTTLLDMYWNVLRQFDMEAIKNAFQFHIQHPDRGRYMPKPADVVHYLQGSHSEQALGAWSKVIAAIQRFGSYQSLVFDDLYIHAVIRDMGGWVHLSTAMQRDIPYRAHEFEKRYIAYLCRPPLHYPKLLNGRLAGQQSTVSCSNEALLFVGDINKAQQVYEQGQDKPKLK